jgi:hypothetical protein
MRFRVCFLLLIFAGAIFAQQACNIGGVVAVDKNRKLAPGEEITMETGGIVVIAQREAPGSTHIVFRRCVLQNGEPVVIGGLVPWAKNCGNAIIQTEGWKLPLTASQKKRLVPGTPVSKADPVQNPSEPTYVYEDKRIYIDNRVDIHNPPPVPIMPAVLPEKKKSHKKVWALVAVGAGVAVGVCFGLNHGNGLKDPVTIIRTGP